MSKSFPYVIQAPFFTNPYHETFLDFFIANKGEAACGGNLLDAQKQILKGISPENVVCSTNQFLIFNQTNFALCVDLQKAKEIVQNCVTPSSSLQDALGPNLVKSCDSIENTIRHSDMGLAICDELQGVERSPSMPLNLTAKVMPISDIILTWSPPKSSGCFGITGYKIERSEAGGPFTTIVNYTGSTLTYSDDVLKPATAYTYRVSASNGVYISAPSNTATVTTLFIPTSVSISPYTPLAIIGNNITLSAYVGNMASPYPSPTGNVTFGDEGSSGTFSSSSCILSSGSCSVTYTTPFRLTSVPITVSYEGDASHTPSKGTSSLIVATASAYYLNPREQLKLGIVSEDVICPNGLVLVEKSDANMPACVKPGTASQLVQMGWGHITKMQQLITREDAINITKKNIPYSPIRGSSFGVLKYNETKNGTPLFLIYELSPNLFSFHTGKGYQINLMCNHDLTCGNYTSKTMGRFVWIVGSSEGAPGTTNIFFVDAKTGEIVGSYNPCPMCVCLSGNTLIDTPYGSIDIRELKTGMPVWTMDHFGHKQATVTLKTTKNFVGSPHLLIHVTLSDGRQLFASASHPTTDGRFIGSLSKGDNLDYAQVVSIDTASSGENYTYDILPASSTEFYWANGILVKSTLK